MVHLYVGPGEPVIRSLLEVKSVVFVGLCCGAWHEAIEDRGIVLYAGARQADSLKSTQLCELHWGAQKTTSYLEKMNGLMQNRCHQCTCIPLVRLGKM